MCSFVSIAVPEAKRATLRSMLPREVRLLRQDNADLRALVHEDDGIFALGTSLCGCDLFNETEPQETTPVDLHRQQVKYLKKGWSKAKIERALAQSASAQLEGPSFVGIRPDVRQALAGVALHTRCLHIFVHEYRGSLTAARIVPAGRRKVGVNDLRDGKVEMVPDHLYSVVA